MAAPPAPTPAAAEKRERILRAALEVCGARGVEAARMDEVAARAGVSKGTLYRFFRSKEDLFLATLIAAYEAGLHSVDVSDDGTREPRERLEALVDGLCRVQAVVGPHMGTHYQAWGVVAKQPVFEDRLHGFLQRFHADRDAEIEALIRDGQRAGVFRRDIDVPALATGASMLLSGFLYRSSFDPAGATPEGLRACLDSMLKTVLLVETCPTTPSSRS